MDMRAFAARKQSSFRTAGSWVTDLAELGKAICLCHNCEPKFNAHYYNYTKQSRPPLGQGVEGDCDGCKQHTLCKLYMKG